MSKQVAGKRVLPALQLTDYRLCAAQEAGAVRRLGQALRCSPSCSSR